MKTSLVISTYNWPIALMLTLESVKSLTVYPDEVLIADDGSRSETAVLVKSYQNDFPIPLVHVWHKDDGFRLAEIRNKAIKESKGDYIIQIDGDIILHPNFVKDHKNLAEKKTFLTGSRVLLGERVSKEIVISKKIKFTPFSKNITNRLNAIYFPLLNVFFKPKRKPIQKLIFKVRGCNMSFWKEDLLNINGYNEALVGWGREDSEIAARLLNNGIALRKVKFSAIEYHQFHPMASRNGLNENNQILEETIYKKVTYIKNGIN